MSIKIREEGPDRVVSDIFAALQRYDAMHREADIEIYRQNPVSVRIRILNPEFAGKSRAQREEEVWRELEQLPEETAADISLLLLLTPAEAKNSFASFEFDDPVPSRL
jgi:hypothetical protein